MPIIKDEQRKKIIADYIDSGNYSETARMNNVSEGSVRNIIKSKDYEEITRLCEEKKLKNTQSTLEYMDSQHETKKHILDKILKAIEEKCDNIDMFTNIKDLATAYGIIIDKELKRMELNKYEKNGEEITKVQELLNKITDEANK